MSEAEIVALDGRVTILETTIPAALLRIENLIRQEIHDLKTEQLGDIKVSIDRVERDTKITLDRIERDIKKEVDRIADDQRRLWEHVGKLELRESQRYGGDRKLGAVWNFVWAVISSLVTFLAAWLSFGRPPHS